MKAKVTAIGNAGFEVSTGALRLFVDAFYARTAWRGSAPHRKPQDIAAANLILVTHDHFDHFDEDAVATVAEHTGASVAGPAKVIAKLRGQLPTSSLVELEPPARLPGARVAASQKVDLPGVAVTAFRTHHSPDHNSYLVATPEFRFFHDGDNENTRILDPGALGSLDALFVGPWQGAGWVEFVEAVRPAHWFLMHLDDEELAQHAAGVYLQDLCDRVPQPDRLVVLRPGEEYDC